MVAPCHSPSGHPRRYEDNGILTVGGTTRPEEPFRSPICGVQEQAPVRLGRLAAVFLVVEDGSELPKW